MIDEEMLELLSAIGPGSLSHCGNYRCRVCEVWFGPIPQTREARLEEIERRRDTVLAEANPKLPTYEAK